MFCTHCGSNVPEGVKFCTECGSPLVASNIPEQAQLKQGQPQQLQFQAVAQQPCQPQAAGQPLSGQNQPFNRYGASPVTAAIPNAPAAKKKSRGPLVAVIVAVVAAVAIVAGGFATNWFGLARGSSPLGSLLGGDALYVVTARTTYDADGAKTGEFKIEFDESGNCVTREWVSYDKGKVSSRSKNEYTYDENGYATKRKSTFTSTYGGTDSGDSAKTVRFENEFDATGKLVKQTDSDDYRTTYEYYPNGQMKREKWEYVGNDDYASLEVYEYDENGYTLSTEWQWEYSGGDKDVTLTSVEWEFDSKGNPVSYVVSGTEEDDGKTKKAKAAYTVDVDEHGNIVAVYDEDGNLRMEASYKRIDNPSRGARDRYCRLFHNGLTFN